MALPELQARERALVVALHAMPDRVAQPLTVHAPPAGAASSADRCDSSLSTTPFGRAELMVASGGVKAPSKGWVSAATGIEIRSLVEGEGNALVLFRIAPGMAFSTHQHDFPEYGTLVSGRGKLVLPDGPQDILEGDSYYVPSGTVHGFESVEQTGPVVLLHVSVGGSGKARRPMFRHLLGQSRELALVRPGGGTTPRLFSDRALESGTTVD